MRKLEAAYLGKLVGLGCVMCRYRAEVSGLNYAIPQPGSQLVVIHHMRAWEGGAQRAENWLAVPLCVEHHTGATGVHEKRTAMKQYKLDEGDLLCLSLRYYHETYGA